MKKTTLFLLISIMMPSFAMAEKEPIVCPPDKPLAEYNRECFSCDTLRGVYNQECSSICSNRKLDEYGHCILKECPPDNPLRGSGYNACSREDAYGLTDWECAQIPGTQFFEDNDGATGTCTFGCPEEKPIKVIVDERTREFKCFSCDDPAALDLGFRQSYERSNCLQCANRELNGNICFLKGECPKDFPIRDSNGGCRATDDPLPITFMEPKNEEESLRAYVARENIDFQKQQCALYPERIYDYKNGCILETCPSDKPMRVNAGCYDCETDEKLKTDEQTCQLCSNRIMYGNLCSLPCPQDKPLADKEGRCHPCDENEANRSIDSPNCSVCPNRYSVHTKYSDICILTCPKDKPLRDEVGECHSCDEIARIRVAAAEVCQICPNRIVLDTGNSCVLCPTDKPQVDIDGNCYACSAPVKIEVNGNISNACETEREIVEKYSILKSCPPDKPLRDKNGECFACNDGSNLVDLEGVTNNCKLCPNRKLIGRYCMIPCPEEKPILEVSYGFAHCYSCDSKGDYGIGLARLNVTGAEEQCNMCQNRKIRRERHEYGTESYCIGKD
ncbi:MAG: hypothetical protein IKS41_03575 [Alphaproteobacteria bacterium]|nr:hypothetical protein [Alphaproteobacteria bacterium]